MSAVIRAAHAAGVEKQLDTTVSYSVGTRASSTVAVRVTYCVSYPPAWHHYHGLQPAIEIKAVRVECGADWKREHLPDFLYQLILADIQAREELNGPFGGD